MFQTRILSILLITLAGIFRLQQTDAQSLAPFAKNNAPSLSNFTNQVGMASAARATYGTRFSVMLNVRTPFTLRKNLLEEEDRDDNFIFDSMSAMSLNLRFYNIRGWALRVGAGYQKLNYSITQSGVNIDYEAYRRDYTLLLGVEKHFEFVNFDFYPGIVIPISYVGDEIIESEILPNIANNALHGNFGVLLGGQVKLFKVLRVGVEAYCMYGQFRQEVWNNFNARQEVKVQNLDLAFDFVIGVAF